MVTGTFLCGLLFDRRLVIANFKFFFMQQAGSINCETEASLCKELGMHHLRSPRIFVYSYKAGDKGSLVEYNENLVAKNLKSFCQDHLPRFSKRINLSRFEFPSGTGEGFPKVLLLSTKKDTPVIWRVLSGLYHDRLIFYDTEVCYVAHLLR